MKRSACWFCTVCIFLILTGCDKPDKEPLNKKMTFIKTLSGGCNIQVYDVSEKSFANGADTVIFTKRQDTLDIFVGMNYICCAPFATESIISNDSILMVLHDGCIDPGMTCYCHCMCYYTWNFLYTGFEEKAYYFRILLNDPKQEKSIVFKEGKVDLAI